MSEYKREPVVAGGVVGVQLDLGSGCYVTVVTDSETARALPDWRERVARELTAKLVEDGETLDVWIPGEPKGQPRPKAFSRDGRARVYDPGTAEGWKGLVALALRPHLHKLTRVVAEDPLAYDSASRHVPIADAWFVDMLFKMPRPAAMRRRKPHPEDGEIPHTKKPDVDNLAKAVLDVCTTLRLWHDDSQVVGLRVRKVYHVDKGGAPGVRLVIRPERQGQGAALADEQEGAGG